MIYALIKAQCLSLFRDRMALLLSFALPCVMFTVFAIIFGGQSGGGQPGALRILIIDQDQSKSSRGMEKTLRGMSQLTVVSLDEISSAESEQGSQNITSETPLDELRTRAAQGVRGGKAAAAVIFPKGLESDFAAFGKSDRIAVEVIHDPANPMAEQMLTGLLQASAFTSAPDMLMERGLDQFRQLGGPFSPLQETAVAAMKSFVKSQETTTDATQAQANNEPTSSGLTMQNGLIRIQSKSARDVLPDGGSANSGITASKMISYYAAGISVMFIMFSMSGAASSLLEHQERGTLERLLSGHFTTHDLILAHWAFYVLLGVLQISLMFVFANVVFGLDLWHFQTLAGAGLMALASSMASAAFIIMIASLVKSRKQLEGLSSIVILIMSAIGGSMMPRFIMPTFVLKLSSVAFNAWSMDGFLKVFWYTSPDQSIVMSILPELAVILTMASLFLGIAMTVARKWSYA